MIQEESEHQQKLEDHHRKFHKSNEEMAKHGGEEEEDTFESTMNSKLNSMEQLLQSFDSSEENNKSKKKKMKKKSLLKKKVGLGSSTSFGSSLGTMVVGALTPLDSLEEKSRETDSYSTPLNNGNGNAARGGGGKEGMEVNTTLHPLMRPAPSTMSSLRQYLPSPDGSFDKSDDGSY